MLNLAPFLALSQQHSISLLGRLSSFPRYTPDY